MCGPLNICVDDTCICYNVTEVAWRKVPQVPPSLALAEPESKKERGWGAWEGGGASRASRASPRQATWPRPSGWGAGAGNLARQTATPVTPGQRDSFEERHVSVMMMMIRGWWSLSKHSLQHCTVRQSIGNILVLTIPGPAANLCTTSANWEDHRLANDQQDY